MTPEKKEALRQRFLNFEAFNGTFIFIPWGAGFVYYGFRDIKGGYEYALKTVGIALIIWGLRKLLVNRIKQQAKVALQVEQAKAELIVE